MTEAELDCLMDYILLANEVSCIGKVLFKAT